MDMRDRRCGSNRVIEKACSCLAHTINWSCHLKVKTEESFPNDFQTVFIASVQFSVFYAVSYHFLRLAQIVCWRKIRAISTWKLYIFAIKIGYYVFEDRLSVWSNSLTFKCLFKRYIRCDSMLRSLIKYL